MRLGFHLLLANTLLEVVAIAVDLVTQYIPHGKRFLFFSLLDQKELHLCYGRRSKQEYLQFLHIALGSLRELDTQLIIAKEVDLADKNLFTPILNEVEEMQSILVATLNKLKD